MADVKRCDRCGKIYNPKTDGKHAVITATVRNEYGVCQIIDGIDLCQSCFKNFLDWIYAKEK